MTTLIFLGVLCFVAYRTMTPEGRAKLPHVLKGIAIALKDYGREQLQPFHVALRARTPFALVTGFLILVSVLTLFWMRRSGATADPVSLVAWGANFGPRTTNGEWWRLITALFVWPGTLTLLLNLAALGQVGWVEERIVGPFVFGVTLISAGLLTGVLAAGSYPTGVIAGGAALTFGAYGLLLVSIVAGRIRPYELSVPPAVILRIAPVAAIVTLTNLASGGVAASIDAAGLLVGIAFGAALAFDVRESTPAPKRVAIALGVAMIGVIAAAIPIRGILDVKPELQRVVAVEKETAATYDTAAAQLKKGRITADALAQTIDRSIVPVLKSADDRMAALKGVPPEDKPRVADAREYLRLRSQSWTLLAQSLREAAPVAANRDGSLALDATYRTRAQARHRSSAVARGRAEAAERAALDALSRVSGI